MSAHWAGKRLSDAHRQHISEGICRAQARGCYPRREWGAEKFRRARYHSDKRGIEWNLSFEEYVDVIKGVCHYCGGALPKYGTSLDRKNNSIGYTKENIVPCCATCNDTKGAHLSYDEMIMLVEYRRRNG